MKRSTTSTLLVALLVLALAGLAGTAIVLAQGQQGAAAGRAVITRGAGMMARGAGMMAQGAGMMARGRMVRQGAGQAPAAGPLGFGRSILNPRMARQLELTETQRTEIRALLQRHRDEAQALAERGQPIRKQLDDAIQSNNPAAIDALAPELGTLQAENAKLRAKLHAEIFALLTPEQQEKAKTLNQQTQRRGQRLPRAGVAR